MTEQVNIVYYLRYRQLLLLFKKIILKKSFENEKQKAWVQRPSGLIKKG
jgi:hypothetical protein